jgi:uncharacterized membrane protein
MSKSRLEAFSDGVIAILITIMVLELRIPEAPTWEALLPRAPLFLAYVLSFVQLGIYWNNHHHLFQVCTQVNGRVLWANLHLLFWLSLVPFATGWIGETNFSGVPLLAYGAVMWMAGLSWTVLNRALLRLHGNESPIARALGRDRKGMVSLVLFILGIVLSLVVPWAALVCYGLAILPWFVPDRRIERVLN